MTVTASSRPELSRPAGRPLQRILIVEDQPQLLRALQINLRARQYEVLTARTGQEALAAAAASPPDAMILDLGLPDVDGTEVITAFRGWSKAPIIVLSGRTSPGDKIGALDAGADDYVTKPFAIGELLARLRAALRRDETAGQGASLVAAIGRWAIDLSAHTIQDSATGTKAAGSPAPRLTPTEWRILEILLRRPGQLVSSAQMLAGVWGPGFQSKTNYLRFHMARLRRKLEEDPSRPRNLLTEPGMGYRYQPLGSWSGEPGSLTGGRLTGTRARTGPGGWRSAMAVRGQLRVYLGAAPGVGKTYAMLAEAHRRAERGTDVVVGYVETHGRAHTAELLDGLEVIARKPMTYRGAQFTELDADAVIARRPQVALVDELAHTNIPGSKNAKRWQDIEEILDAGITVITNLNIQHLESLNDVVRQITGVPQRETVPDEVVRRADQVELVDMAPEALRRRMAHGNIYPAEKIDAALSNYFRVGNLTALRELALLWTAGKVDEQLERYRAEHGIAGTWEARERVVVALSGGPEGDTLIRRAARIADRGKGADLLAVHVTRSDGLAGAGPKHLARQRILAESLGGTYHQVVGEDVPHALLEFARAVNATQLVLGVSRRARVAQLLSRGVGMTTTALSGPIDVHMVTHEQAQKGRRRRRLSGGLTARRRAGGFAVAAAGLPLATVALAGLRGQLSLPSDILIFLLVVVAAAISGGFWPGITAAVAGFFLLNYYFTEPYHTFAMSHPDNVVALTVFVAVAAAVSAVVGLAARRSREASRAGADAEVLFHLAGNILRGEHALTALLERLRETFGQESATLLEHRPGAAVTPDRQRDPAAWQVAVTVGGRPCAAPDEGDTDIPVGEDLALVLRGRPLPAGSRRIAEAFAAQAAAALRQQRLAEQAERARPIAAADQMRAALLTALSHDLRSPLAAATAAVDSLADPTVTWTPGEQAELAGTAQESLGQLCGLVDNLLDMTRLQAGALGVHAQPVAAADIISRVLDGLGDHGRRIRVSLPPGLPGLLADPALLERVLANLLGNAIRYSLPGQQVLLTASSQHDQVELRVADRGPGIPPADRGRAFQPFQRLSGHDAHPGPGLGLALARGLTEAMNGTLTPDDTPGGGLTMIITLPAASPAMAQPGVGGTQADSGSGA